jgi:hypothetical protein
MAPKKQSTTQAAEIEDVEQSTEVVTKPKSGKSKKAKAAKKAKSDYTNHATGAKKQASGFFDYKGWALNASGLVVGRHSSDKKEIEVSLLDLYKKEASAEREKLEKLGLALSKRPRTFRLLYDRIVPKLTAKQIELLPAKGGRYCGKNPLQALKKAFNRISKILEIAEMDITGAETTQGFNRKKNGDRKEFSYRCRRIELDEPRVVTAKDGTDRSYSHRSEVKAIKGAAPKSKTAKGGKKTKASKKGGKKTKVEEAPAEETEEQEAPKPAKSGKKGKAKAAPVEEAEEEAPKKAKGGKKTKAKAALVEEAAEDEDGDDE